MGGMTEDGDKSSKAFAAIGISFDEIKGKSPEEALNITIRALQEMPAGADRTAAALKLFGKGAMELQPLLNKTAAETDELRQRAHDLGLVLSDEQIDAAGKFRSAMGKINDTMQGMKLQIASSLVPAFADGLSAFMDFANGVEGGEEKMKSAVDNITVAITETVPKFVEKGAAMVSALIQGLSQALPGIAAAIAQVLPMIVGVITTMMPPLIDTIMGAVPLIVQAILSMLPSVVEAAVKIILALADGLAKMLPTLIPTALNAVVTIIKTVITMLPDVILAGADIMKSLAQGLGNAIPLLKPITAAISGIIDVIKTIAPFVLAAAAAFAAFYVINTITSMMKGLTLATAAQTIATNIQTVATTIATAVQWLLNAAMLANPIGLLIAGVAALAAGIAVLIIWFNRESEEQKRLKESTKKLIEENDKLNESIGNTKGAYDEKTASMAQDANAAKSLADKIAELSAKENKSAEEKRKLAAYVGMLNEAMGETVVTYNEESDALSENMDAIYGRIAAMKEEARAQAARERAVEIAKEQMAVEEQLNKIGKQREEWVAALEAGTVKQKAFNKEMNKLNDSEAELIATQDDLAESFEYATSIVAEAAEKQAEANQTIIDSTDALSNELQAAYDLQEELAAKRIEREQEVTDAMTIAASEQGLTLEEYKKNLEEAQKTIETYTTAATDMFKKMNDKSELSVRDMTENMKHNQSVLETWSDNLVALADKGIDQGLLERLKKAGPESAGTVAALVKASDKELKELNDVFANGSKVATDALMKQLGCADVVDSGADMVDDIASGVTGNKGLETAAEQLIQDAKRIAASTVSSSNFNDIGTAIVEGVWQGMNQKESWFRSQVKSFFKNIVGSVKSELGISSPSKVFAEIGKHMAEGVGVGFEDEMDDVSKAMQDAIPTTLDAPDLEIDTGINAALNGAGVAVSIADLGYKLDGIAGIMTQMFPALLQALNIRVVLDDGTLVGRLAPEIDKNLGLLHRQRAILGV